MKGYYPKLVHKNTKATIETRHSMLDDTVNVTLVHHYSKNINSDGEYDVEVDLCEDYRNLEFAKVRIPDNLREDFIELMSEAGVDILKEIRNVQMELVDEEFEVRIVEYVENHKY